METQLTHEEFNLHNPAYCGFLLYSLLREHWEIDQNGLNSALVYLCLPIVLTKSISTRLPSTSKSSMIAWFVENDGCFYDFSKRASSYFEITQLAIDFLVERQLITVSDDGYLLFVKSKLPKSPLLFTKSLSMKKQLGAAKLMGKWLALSPNASTIYSVLGIKP
tara:strand:+ start:199 stop:690 length:492 start_codon:yes stop_codon:yes gene_type:complete